MYFFLAITLDADVLNGSFWPAYVLCKSYTTSEKRSGWRIVRMEGGVPTSRLPRVLVTETTGHEEMIEFMSSYQVMHPKTKKHYHPKGALCWYSCNQYGDPTGEVVFIKKVPEYVWIFDFSNKGFQKLKKTLAVKPQLNEVLSSEPETEVKKYTDTRLLLFQSRNGGQQCRQRKSKRKNSRTRQKNS